LEQVTSKTDGTTTPAVGVISVPWYQTELVRWLVPLVVSLVVGWLSTKGVTPAPVPPIPAPVAPGPSYLVFNMGPPVNPTAAPIAAAAGK
jgi:hypothetical protein